MKQKKEQKMKVKKFIWKYKGHRIDNFERNKKSKMEANIF